MTALVTSIDFTRGVPAEESFPYQDLADSAEAVLAGPHRAQALQYGPSRGFGPLREWLADLHGAASEQVLVSNGSLQIIDFLAMTLIQPGESVFVEAPTYDRALTILRRRQANVVPILLEPDGPSLAALEEALARYRPAFFYTIPDFQNPAGIAMSRSKRQRIAELAIQHGFWLVEDGPYRRLRYRGEQEPSLRDLNPERTLHLSSFSKQIGPSIRVGYVVGDAAVLDRLAKVAEDSYITPNLLSQTVVNEFCRSGKLEPQLVRLRGLYGPRLEAICRAVQDHLPGAAWQPPDGGFFLSLTLPEGVDNESLRAEAGKHGLKLSDGRGFFVDRVAGERFLRLPFCALTPSEIEEGVTRLAAAVDQASQQTAGTKA
jgi:2-aminoadipate transaminase